MSELESAYEEFLSDLHLEADVSGEPLHACCFKMFSEAAADNGDCEDLTYAPVRSDGARPFQIDGYALDQERGEMHLAICDFRSENDMPSLDKKDIDTMFGRVERFFRNSLKPEFVNSLEETSPAFEVAYTVHSNAENIQRVRCVLLSNAHLVARKKSIEARELEGRQCTFNLLDFSRYAEILEARNGSEPIEIDISEVHGTSLPCLEAHTGGASYRSYLAVIPGALLSELYGLYGARLLEQNVRTFLQARTKVNRGIIKTIESTPEMFFAYNNGLTATASDVGMEDRADGTLGITSISDLQIVNGGQTTASILYARDRGQASLDDVFVQMKLTVVGQDDLEEVVPRISRFANTQNRVNEADFFANHPFHVTMEKISRRLTTPQKPGQFSASKWFYERARGQYRDAAAYKNAAEKRKFEAEFPKSQVLVKTDLAKYILTAQGQPEVVSQGAQKCFLAFAEVVAKEWEKNPDNFNDDYFKDAIAKAIVFRWTDKMVSQAEWYVQDRGYKANIVTYSVAWLFNAVRRMNLEIDTTEIWAEQEVPDGLKAALRDIAPAVAALLKDPPSEMKNVSEYCKKQVCWSRVSGMEIDIPVDLKEFAVTNDEVQERRKASRKGKKIDNEIELDTRLLALMGCVGVVKTLANQYELMSPTTERALGKLAAGKWNLSQKEKQGLKKILERLDDEGEVIGS